MKKIIRLHTLAFTILLLCGCHFVFEEVLYNNTGQDLTVTTFHGTENPTSSHLRKAQTAELGGATKLQVRRSDGGTWNYELVPVPFEFHKAYGLNKHLVKEQIQEDGAIYLLSPGTSGPVTNFPPQPSGYPVRPK